MVFDYMKFINKIINSAVGLFGHSITYIKGLLFAAAIDSLLIDDEPLWEPIEWSLVQTWILIIFIFGWIGENLILSRYGGYSGRDKRLWFGWYKTLWLIEIFYIFNFFVVACFVTTPYYFETNYNVPNIYTWWNWLSKNFFLNYAIVFNSVLLLTYTVQINHRWVFWKTTFFSIVLLNIMFLYFLYTQFIVSFWGYWTNTTWYMSTKPIDMIQMSHEPLKWGWGVEKRDHFTYHSSKTMFWYKNDGPIASTMMLIHLYLFLVIFSTVFYWITLFRRVNSTLEIPTTYLTYTMSSLKQFFYVILYLYSFVILSFLYQYWRIPIEFYSSIGYESWLSNAASILCNYANNII